MKLSFGDRDASYNIGEIEKHSPVDIEISGISILTVIYDPSSEAVATVIPAELEKLDGEVLNYAGKVSVQGDYKELFAGDIFTTNVLSNGRLKFGVANVGVAVHFTLNP